MPQKMHVKHNYHRNTMEPNSQLLSYLTPSLKHKGNEVPQKRKPMEYIMLYQNGITTSKDPIS